MVQHLRYDPALVQQLVNAFEANDQQAIDALRPTLVF
jgi:hypothetical protein